MLKILDQRAEESKAFMENVETEDLQLDRSQMQEGKNSISQVSNQRLLHSLLEIDLKSVPSFSPAQSYA